MPIDFKKIWMEKSQIEYYSPFLSLWLACNSWYQSHYSELTGSDRDFINKLKTDFTGRNHLFDNFSHLIDRNDRTGIAFRTNIELLHYYLVKAELVSKNIGLCSFSKAVIEFNKPNHVTMDLIKSPKINQDGSVNASDLSTVIKLDKIYITSDKQNFFAGLFEIIYQVRNMLVHGKINPEPNSHEVVKYCYLVLWELMKET